MIRRNDNDNNNNNNNNCTAEGVNGKEMRSSLSDTKTKERGAPNAEAAKNGTSLSRAKTKERGKSVPEREMSSWSQAITRTEWDEMLEIAFMKGTKLPPCRPAVVDDAMAEQKSKAIVDDASCTRRKTEEADSAIPEASEILKDAVLFPQNRPLHYLRRRRHRRNSRQAFQNLPRLL